MMHFQFHGDLFTFIFVNSADPDEDLHCSPKDLFAGIKKKKLFNSINK